MPYALDPELATPLAAMPKGPNGAVMDLTDIPALRAAIATTAAGFPAPVPDPRVTVTTHVAHRDDGTTLDIVLFRPDDAPLPAPALAWFHAGGQILGSAHDDAEYHAALALALNCVVAAVDYRLAPDTPAPGAAEDGYLAYTTLVKDAAALGIDAARIGLAGASGGGAPAAATALMIRDRGAAKPCLLALNYPMLDDRNETPSSRQVVDLGIWDRRENLLAWAAVLGDRAGTSDVDAYSAPARATDLHDLPETFIAAAQYDVFRDEDIAFAAGLMAAGVPVELHVYPHAFHAWDRFAPTSRLTTVFEQTWHGFVIRHLHA
ncbi:alpha/beta hydrolase fold domain-containing protein [Actinoplanes sp. RD1]|uniref:alpha/beta hydrolase fold domain-containing protein n=1 Tax=Actinoplanes sp. RD1 TaxID=3064538 RepID=UPI0027406876|nr:alpha/beta hydrolase fold domain-containing protein [Actinoplanes sp. RD1]